MSLNTHPSYKSFLFTPPWWVVVATLIMSLLAMAITLQGRSAARPMSHVSTGTLHSSPPHQQPAIWIAPSRQPVQSIALDASPQDRDKPADKVTEGFTITSRLIGGLTIFAICVVIGFILGVGLDVGVYVVGWLQRRQRIRPSALHVD